MASEAGPNLVTDGLVLSLDAANTQSYPGRQQNVHVPRDKFPREKRHLAPTYHQQVDFSLKKKR